MKTLAALPFLGLLFVSNPSIAHAGLGQPESAVAADTALLHGTHQAYERAQVRVHEIKTDGQTVREYVAPEGTVFAVTWRGIGEPILESLLGSYFSEYRGADASTSTPAGRMPKVVRSANLVVLKSGHMRDISGKAYCPKLLPKDFNMRELK